MSHDPRPIGVFDSGVGGLTVVRALRDALPSESILYFGDTARVPYGGKSAETVQRYSAEITTYLMARDVKCIVVACNTASALALDRLRERFDLPVLGVVEPGAAAAAAATAAGRIGVVGTRSTVASGAYQRAIKDRLADAEVTTRSCPLFVPLVEEMWLDTPTTRDVIAHYLDPLLGVGIDTLLLGCTHYPFLHASIARHCGRGVTVIDSARSCAETLSHELAAAGLAAPPSPTNKAAIHVCLTDTPDRFLPLANDFLDLGLDTGAIEAVPPENLG